MKAKILTALLGIGMGLGSLSSVAGPHPCMIEMFACMESNSERYCEYEYKKCRGYI